LTAKTASDTPADEAGGVEDLDEVAEILVEPRTAEIAGITVKIRRMRTRELLKLMRIITVGMGSAISLIDWDTEDTSELTGQMTAVVLNALPHAPDEVIDFLNVMIDAEGRTLKERKALAEEMQNPDLEVTMLLIQIILETEAPELARLGKEAVGWWKQTGILERMKK